MLISLRISSAKEPAALPSATPDAVQNYVPLSEKSGEKIFSEYAKTVADDSKDYREFLESESKEHTAFWEWWIEKICGFTGVLATVVGGLFVFFNWTSKRQIRDEVESKFKNRVDSMVKEQLASLSSSTTSSVQAIQTQVSEFQEFMKQTRDQIEAESKRTDNLLPTIDVAAAMSFSAMVLTQLNEGAHANASTSEAVKMLENVRKTVPQHRRLAIFLGRLYRRLKKLPEAILVLDEACEARDKIPMERDSDYGDLLYNKACYLNLLARDAGEPKREELRKSSWEVLTNSIKLNPDNFSCAKEDNDLAELVQTGDRTWDKLQS
ncbi:MAG: hypothetical protein WCD79_10390 [Chthoniobacteraceae bacterium]